MSKQTNRTDVRVEQTSVEVTQQGVYVGDGATVVGAIIGVQQGTLNVDLTGFFDEKPQVTPRPDLTAKAREYQRRQNLTTSEMALLMMFIDYVEGRR